MNDADKCRANGWGPGTRLVGDEGCGPSVIEITAVGEMSVLAKLVKHGDESIEQPRETCWSLRCRDWTPKEPSMSSDRTPADVIAGAFSVGRGVTNSPEALARRVLDALTAAGFRVTCGSDERSGFIAEGPRGCQPYHCDAWHVGGSGDTR